MQSSEEFNEAWEALHRPEGYGRFDVSFADIHIVGDRFRPDGGHYESFEPLQSQGMAYRWLEIAHVNGALEYIVTANGVCVAFYTAFGWAFIPLKYYAWGRLPKGFRGVHGSAQSFLKSVLEARDDDERH